MSAQKHGVWKMMTDHVIEWNCIPAVMLDTDPRLVADCFEAHLDMSKLIGRKGFRPPGKGKPHARIPRNDLTDFENFPVRQNLDQSPPGPGSNLSRPGDLRVKRNSSFWPPPAADLAREHLECMRRRGGHANRHQNVRGHP